MNITRNTTLSTKALMDDEGVGFIDMRNSVNVYRAIWAFKIEILYIRKLFIVVNHKNTYMRLIGAARDLPRGRKRPKDENAKIKKGRILDIWPVHRCLKRFQATYLALSDN